MPQHVGEPLVALRRLVGARAAQLHALEDHRVIAHGAAHETPLFRERRRRALPHHPHALAVVLLEPREVVVIVHLVAHARPQHAHHLGAHQVAAGVGVVARESHGGQVVVEQCLPSLEHERLDVHAVACASGAQEVRRQLVPEPARAEVHTHPDPVLFVGEQVHVVVAGADRAELLVGERLELRGGGQAPFVALEHFRVHALLVLLPHPERQPPPDVVHERGDPRTGLATGHVGENRLVAAADVVAHARRREGVPLSANVRETPTPRKFSVEGESGSEDVDQPGGPTDGGGDRGGGEGGPAAVHGRREAAGAARGGPLHEAGGVERVASA